MDTINIILADDHEIVRKGIKLILENEENIQVIAEAGDGEETLEIVKEYKPDVAIVDIRMPKLNGIQTTEKIKARYPEVKVLILTMHDDEEYITQSIDCGADGYLLKDTGKEEFLKAILTVHNGQKYFSGDISNILVNRYLSTKSSASKNGSAPDIVGSDYDLTKREKQILKMIYLGVSNKEVADELGKSIRTIETHRFNIMKKLSVNNITDLLRKVDNDTYLKQILEV